MASRPGFGDVLPPWMRALPADLAATITLVFLVNGAVFLPIIRETPVRIVLGLPFVLFVPGYAFIAALFPEQGSSPVEETTADSDDPDLERDESGIDGIERVALSFGLSIAIVPLIGLILNFTPWGIRLAPIMVAVSGFTLIATAFAQYRREELPPEERFRVPYREWYAAGKTELFEPESRADAALNVLLVLSIVMATASVGYAVMVPKEGEKFSEQYILTETDEGDLIADGYPTEFVQGESKPIVLGVGNHEQRPVEYSIVVELQEVRIQNNSTIVLRQEELGRLQTGEIPHNGTWMTEYNVTPTMTGEELRLIFLLYKGEAPAEADEASAYREVHLFINVSESSAAGRYSPADS